MKKLKYSKIGRNTFLVSFLAGTLLLISYVVSRADFLIISGFYFLITAVVINLLVLLYELLEFLTDVSERKASGNSALLLMLNIPVTLLYLFIVYRMNI